MGHVASDSYVRALAPIQSFDNNLKVTLIKTYEKTPRYSDTLISFAKTSAKFPLSFWGVLFMNDMYNSTVILCNYLTRER